MPSRAGIDFLVIGSGLAGLSFALKAARYGRVVVVAKRVAEDSASSRAQGGIASVLSREDSFENHAADTLRTGAGICDPDVVKLCVTSGPDMIGELISLGVKFTKKTGRKGGADEFDLGLEGGHSKRRILHAGDITGREIIRTLAAAARAEPNIEILEGRTAVDLITTSRLGLLRVPNQCLGAYVLDSATSAVTTMLARATVIATGGAGKVYLYTSNPDTATGDGMAMAWRAGAAVANMEFVQFHPTCLYHPEERSFLISEALRGEGGVLRNLRGEAFVKRHHPSADLATRDVVARAIDMELKRTGDDYVLLDMTGLPKEFIPKRFPNIHAHCLSLGIDMRERPIPVVPAAHYFCGGVVTDDRGRTAISRLLVIGESSCTGLHGANRLASNSLLEALVFADRAASLAPDIMSAPAPGKAGIPDWDVGSAVAPDEAVMVSQNWDEIRRFMWNYVGIVRSDKRLMRAYRRIQVIKDEIREYYWNYFVTRDIVELRNIATVAALVIECARTRRESRGLHFNIDHPGTDDARWKRSTVVRPQ
jgi:L-aspartate oxidase